MTTLPPSIALARDELSDKLYDDAINNGLTIGEDTWVSPFSVCDAVEKSFNACFTHLSQLASGDIADEETRVFVLQAKIMALENANEELELNESKMNAALSAKQEQLTAAESRIRELESALRSLADRVEDYATNGCIEAFCYDEANRHGKISLSDELEIARKALGGE